MEASTYTLKKNAKAAASRMMIKGTAPAPDFRCPPKAVFVSSGQPRRRWRRNRKIRPRAGPRRLSPRSRRANGRPGTALAKVINLLRRPEGATIVEIQAVTGWLPHTTRAFISVSVKRKAGLDVVTEKVESRGRVYRLAGPGR